MLDARAGVEPVPLAAPRPRGTAMRSVALHALAAAMMYVSPLHLFVPAAYVSSGLRNGRRGIWGAILISVLIVAGAILAGQTVFGTSTVLTTANLNLVLRLVFEIGIPSVAVMLMIRRGATMGQAILVGVGIAALGFFAEEALMRRGFQYSPYEAIAANIRGAWEKSIEAQAKLGFAREGLDLMRRISRALTGPFMPFLLVAASMLTFIMSLVMIPRLPAGRDTGDRYLFRNLRWPDPMLFGFIAGGAAPLLDAGSALRMTLQNVLAVVAFLYLIQGLAIFRSLVLRLGIGFLGAAFAYVLLGLLTFWGGIAPFILFLGGLFDPFFDFRNLQRKGESDESHSD